MSIKNIFKYVLVFFIILASAVLMLYRQGSVGYVNLSDSAIILLMEGLIPSYGMIVAALACSISSIILGYDHLATSIFIAKLVEGYVVAALYQKKQKSIVIILSGCLTSLFISLLFGIRLFGTQLVSVLLKVHLIQMVLTVCVCGLISFVRNRKR